MQNTNSKLVGLPRVALVCVSSTVFYLLAVAMYGLGQMLSWEGFDITEFKPVALLFVATFTCTGVAIISCAVLGRPPRFLDKLFRGHLSRELSKLSNDRRLQIATIAVSMIVLAFAVFLTVWVVTEG